MKYSVLLVALLATILKPITAEETLTEEKDATPRGQRVARQTSADQMVQNILQWLQGVYTQNARKIRQGTLREYLPPSNTQKPRPFEPVGYPPAGITPQPPFPSPGGETPPYTGFPSSQPPFTGFPYLGFPQSSPGFDFAGYPGFPTQRPGFPTQRPGFPTQRPGFPTQPPTGYPTQRPGFPTQPPTGYPTQRPGFPTQPPTGYPTQRPGFPTQPPTGYPTQRPGFPTQPPTGYPTQRPGFPTQPPTGYPTQPTTGYPTPSPTGYPTQRPGFPTQPPESTGYPTQRPGFPTQPPPSTGYPTQPPASTGYPTPGSTTGYPSYTTQPPTQPPATYGPPVTTEQPQTPGPSTNAPITSAPTTYYTSPAITSQPTEAPSGTTTTQGPEVPEETEGPEGTLSPETPPPTSEDESKHPPHIHAIEVECAKDMMTINIEFNREFNGIIYSKGYYDTPECRYVNENSEQTKYKFTVNLNSCGTEFINAFDTQGQSYLENVLVIQNEQGIQEVWDTIRAVRCLWEGNLKDSLSVALSVGMLSQEIVTFSGDTAMAKLDIQLGRGPFAAPANGLVKIGEQMTLVISVSGDPGFDLQVKDCKATDSTGDRSYQLTDENGCILKPKLFGAFQKTRETRDTGASIIAYAFFNAFKFPDVMDLMIQCNIELCKTDCQVCPEPNQQIEPGRRRRRDVGSFRNNTLGEGVTMGKHLRVILPEELSESGYAVIDVNEMQGICMSTQNFVFATIVMISLLTASSVVSACLWFKNQRLARKM